MKLFRNMIVWVAILFGLLFFIAAYSECLGYAELFYEDILYQNEDRIDNKIKIIAIDDYTINKLGNYNNWSRQMYADLLNRLNSNGCKPAIVAFDVMFSDTKDAEGDSAFAAACKNSGNVIVASKLSTSASYDPERQKIDFMHVIGCMSPYEELASGVKTGYVNVIIDDDGYVRHSMAKMQSDDREYCSFSTQIAKSYLLTQKRGLSTEDSFLINYCAKPNSYEMISMSDVLDGTVPVSVFDECIVLVGGCSEGFMDSYSVPIDRRTLMYGVEINANIVQSLLEGKSIRYGNRLFTSIITGLVAAIFIYLANRSKIRYMTMELFGAIGIHLIIAIVLSKKGTFVPILYLLFAFIIAYIIDLIWKYVYERRRRTRELHELLFSMAEAMTEAIDGRTPYNASHTRNVAHYSVMLANYINGRNARGMTKIKFTNNEIEQLHLAALLHDIGKMDIPLEILDKPSRLGDRYEPLMKKLEIIRLTIELEAARGIIDEGMEREKLGQIDKLVDFINSMNTKEFMDEDDLKCAKEMQKLSYTDASGNTKMYLSEEEYQCLTIVKGTLTWSEIDQVRGHATYTDKILSKISFGDHYSEVKNIAISHHELLNGKGYPRNLTEESIPKLVRILTIADVYDALTSDDRPYKHAKTNKETFRILHCMADNHEIDEEILNFAEVLWGDQE